MAPRLRALKDEKQIASIPVSEPVLVEIAPTPSGLEQPNVETQPQEPVEVETQTDDGAAKLKKELDALKSASKLNEDALARERQRAEEATRLARQREHELANERSHREQAVNDNITSALAGAQAEQAAAEGEYSAAYKAEDPDAMAKAQGKIARAAAKVLNYEAAAAELADRKQQAPQYQQQPQQQAPVDIVTAVNTNPGLLQPEKEWLLKHQDVLVDPTRGKELEVAYIRATRAGHHRGTDAYFQYLDKELGYANGQQAQASEDDDNDNQSGTNVMAPVSRDNVSPSNGAADTSRQVTLTPEQREFARSMGLTDTAYAAQVLKLRQEKKSNPDKYRG